MTTRIIQKRKRIFIAGEGESEQSFVKWLQYLSDQEGLLLRMMLGNENLQLRASSVQRQLRSRWPDYQKPVDARTLASRFSFNDLLRVARIDVELKSLLAMIGLS